MTDPTSTPATPVTTPAGQRFAVTVRDHLMVAHSLRGEVFGPAQRLHGATFVVDATFRARGLDRDGLVVDIGRASGVLAGIVAALSYRNLDEEPDLQGVNTTTERLCQIIGDRLVDAVRTGQLGDAALTGIGVTLHESHVAWASYEVALGASAGSALDPAREPAKGGPR